MGGLGLQNRLCICDLFRAMGGGGGSMNHSPSALFRCGCFLTIEPVPLFKAKDQLAHRAVTKLAFPDKIVQYTATGI